MYIIQLPLPVLWFLLYRCLGMGAWSLGIWSMGVWGYRCFGYGYLENNCVSQADICQGMHMANSV